MKTRVHAHERTRTGTRSTPWYRSTAGEQVSHRIWQAVSRATVCNMTNTKVKYLEELIVALRSAEVGTTVLNDTSFSELDDKNEKVLHTLLKNINEVHVNEAVLHKSFEALDLLLRSNLIIFSADKRNVPLIELILTNMQSCSITHWLNLPYIWLIKHYIQKWLHVFSFKIDNCVQLWSNDQMEQFEHALLQCLRGKLEAAQFYVVLKRIIITSEWLIAEHSSNNCSSDKMWHGQFQKLLRLLNYVLNSIVVKSEELTVIFSRILSLLVFYVSNSRQSFSIFTFSFDLIQSLIQTQFTNILPVALSKTLLRIFYFAIYDNSMLSYMQSNYILNEWASHQSLHATTNQIIVYLADRLNGNEPKHELFFTNKQLQQLYKHLETIPKIPVYEYENHEQSDSTTIRASFDRIKESIISTKAGNNFKDLARITESISHLASQEQLKIDINPEVGWHSKFVHGLPPSRSDLLPLQKSLAFQLLSRYFLSGFNAATSSEPLIVGIIKVLIAVFSQFEPPKLSDSMDSVTGVDSFGCFDVFQTAYNSRSRYLRLLSIRLLPLFCYSGATDDGDINITFLIKFLQKPRPNFLLETTCMAWINLTLNCDDEYFDNLLLKLIDLFNSSDFSEHTMMSAQLRHLARVQNKTPYQLLSPILPIVFKKIGKNLVEKKLGLQRIVQLVEYPAKTLLDNFQRYVVPYALGQYKGDVITEIARIISDNDKTLIEEKKLKLLDKNSRQIFAVALVKHGFFSIDTIETLFLNTAPKFKKNYITLYLPDYKTLAEILKMSRPIYSLDSESTETEKAVLSSLRFLLMTNFAKDRRRGSKYRNLNEWNEESELQFQRKIEENVLGIFQVFSNDMHDSDGKTSYYEKLRVLNGISFLIKHTSKKCIISALAQLSICLQTGSEIPEIRHNTLQCWHLLVKLLNEEQITAIINDLLCLILQKWREFSQSSKNECHEIFDTLMRERQKLVLDSRPFIILSFLQNSELQVLERHPSVARKLNKIINSTNWLTVFTENLRSNNKYVILQTLVELEKYFGDSLFRKHVDVVTKHDNSLSLSVLLGALLDTSHKFRNKDLKICQFAASCMSLIGLLDVTRHALPRNINLTQDMCDFNNHSQTIKFLINVINDILVPSFWQSENPTKQLFVALVMQESLKYCGLSSSSWDINQPDKYPVEANLWARFNDISKTTLYPLLSSLYLAQSWKEYVPLVYPSFKVKEGYQVWIRNLTLDLLKLGTDEEHPLHVFSSLIREDDGTLSNFLLPCVTMDILLRANESKQNLLIVESLSKEFEYIFNFELQNLNHFQVDSLKMAYNSIFRVYEYCKKWISRFKQDYQVANGTYMIQEDKLSQILDRTEEFINVIPSHILAQKSLETDSFERSALYLEQNYREQGTSSIGTVSLLNYLQTTYAEIGDIDAVDGALKMFSTGNLTTKIEELQYSKNWKMAQDCFEALGDIDQLDTSQVSEELIKTSNLKMLKSMYNHQLYGDLLTKLKILLPEPRAFLTENYADLLNMGIEAVTQTGNISEITLWIERLENIHQFNDPSLLLHYNIAKVIQAANRNQHAQVNRYVDKCFKLIGTHFTSPSTSTTLLKKREVLQKLHALTDIRSIFRAQTEKGFTSVLKTLEGRLSHIGSDFSPNHYLLSIRKSLEMICNKKFLKEDVSNVYYELSQLDRKNNRLDLAADDLMNALKYNHHSAELEFAEILWKQGENDMALKMVAEISKRFSQDKSSKSLKNQDFKEVLLKYTEWLDLSNSSVSEQIIKQYNELIHIDKEWDAPFYSMGLYYSRLLEKKKAEGYISDGSLEYRSISSFLTSFEKGSSNIRQALPKVVTLWLDTTNSAARMAIDGPDSQFIEISGKICSKIDLAVKNCGIHIWYTVLTQLLSRLLHPHTPTIHTIVNILFHMTLEYPSVMLWYISILLNSEDVERRNIGKQISDAFQKKMAKTRLPVIAVSLVQSLTRICIKDVKSSVSRSGRSIDTDFKFNLEIAPNDMCVPVNINLKKLLPSTANSMNSSLFKSIVVTISKFSPQYMVFNSLKKPKKISIIGSDGNIYGIMCKKEDVRQDNQYMQFANAMSFLLSGDVESRNRGLGITTYGVLSLREDCGLLEIVPNVLTLRSLLTMKYESMKIKYSLKSLQEKWQAVPSDQKLAFHKDCLRKFPPVLYQWFLDNFPDPITWYNSRNDFVRSYSVMAMVGHILGLGDRHCENILIDVETGRVLHVDFDCLFEKGKKLPVPEIVPFRLTQNIKDAFGIVGTEGSFKKSSEVTLRVMRDNEVGLVNIIETIMYDRKIDESIQIALKVLRDKIRGIDSRDGLTLSVSGQVEALTQEATSEENLSKMYIGWLPFW